MDDPLFAKLQNDLNAKIEEHYEREKRGPVSLKAGSLQHAAGATAEHALGRIKFGRAYAFDDQSRLELGGIAIATRQKGASLVEGLDVMASTAYVANNKMTRLNWTQGRPELVELGPLPTDVVTGQRARNPFEEPQA